MNTSASRSLRGCTTGLLVSAVAACGAPPSVGVTSSKLSDTPFFIKALGNRCIDIIDTPAGGGALTIQTCNEGITQMFRTGELDGTHDIQLVTEANPTRCVTILGPTGPGLTPGQQLRPQPCGVTEAQRFAFDGDALLVGRQSNPGDRVSRDFVIEPLESNTNEGTPVVVGSRELDDAEYWRMTPVDGSETRPHVGFITVESEVELAFKLAAAEWGDVLELDPYKDEVSIELNSFPFNYLAVGPGVTLRGRHKFMDFGVRLVVPEDRRDEEGFVLRVDDFGRVTQLRMEGPGYHGGGRINGLQIGLEHEVPPDPTNVIVDHVDLSRWSQAAIAVWGGTFTKTHFDCPGEPRSNEPDAKLVGNVIHHLDDSYGILVAAGGFAFIRGNYMFRSSHDVTSSFNNGFNRYVALDNLFTSSEDDGSTIFDVHGNCSAVGSHWVGGRAGDFFEVAFNSFLTQRNPIVQIRGTPCDHFSFHDNRSTQADDSKTMSVATAPYDYSGEWPPVPSDCRAPGDDFPQGSPAVILQMQNNDFEIDNPLYGRLAVGDFDGDGRDDVFLATGATWWFSSGGKVEWRLLNRMPQLVSDLRFGDFDADGRMDVVALNVDQLVVSWAGASRWFPLNAVPGPRIEDLAVGDFDADGRADLFFTDGSQWHWSSGGVGAWNFFAFSGYRASELRFGDFTDDRITDVFRTESGTWYIVRAPGKQWEELGPEQMSAGIEDLVVADFDGDQVADVGADVSILGTSIWMISLRGTSDAGAFNIDDQRMAASPIGRFDDVPGADVLRWHEERWYWLNSPFADERWSTQAMR